MYLEDRGKAKREMLKMTNNFITRKESVENLKIYSMMEKGYINNKFRGIKKHMNTIYELIDNDVKAKVVIDDINGLVNTYLGSIKYMLKQYKNIDINGLDESAENDNYFYNNSDYIYGLFKSLISSLEMSSKMSELREKEGHLNDAKTHLKYLEMTCNEFFRMIDML
jgi:hypothetical protein